MNKIIFCLVLLVFSSISYAANYRDVVNHNQQIVEKQKHLYKPLVDENKKQVSKLEPEHQKIIKQAEEAHKEHAKNIKAEEGSILEEVIENIKNLELEEKKSKNQGIIVFISFSMPKALLCSYQHQAKLYGARLVLRGLVENDFKKTVQAMDLGGDRIMTLDINPMLFKDYGIERVPSIVIAGDQESNESEDKFIGSVSITHALEESSTRGNQKEFSSKRLKKVSAEGR